MRSLVVHYLEQRFGSHVTLGELRIRIPKVSSLALLLSGGRGTIAHVEGRNLSVRYQNRQDVPPLFAINSFAFDLDLGMLRQPRPRIPQVVLEGMSIALPPKTETAQTQESAKGAMSSNVVVDSIDISRARLLILPQRADAQPLDFALQAIHLSSAGAGQQMGYQATLTNPRPPGQILSKGTFGPWNSKSPGDTPLEGDYDFSNADLSVFTGIAGILHSSGHFVGTLSAVRALARRRNCAGFSP